MHTTLPALDPQVTDPRGSNYAARTEGPTHKVEADRWSSLWALIPGVFMACGFIIRTSLEDKTLQEELDGYRDYAQRVKYRLIPKIW